jgi:hypothetical protein
MRNRLAAADRIRPKSRGFFREQNNILPLYIGVCVAIWNLYTQRKCRSAQPIEMCIITYYIYVNGII